MADILFLTGYGSKYDYANGTYVDFSGRVDIDHGRRLCVRAKLAAARGHEFFCRQYAILLSAGDQLAAEHYFDNRRKSTSGADETVVSSASHREAVPLRDALGSISPP